MTINRFELSKKKTFYFLYYYFYFILLLLLLFHLITVRKRKIIFSFVPDHLESGYVS